jgi:hypothetical protein
MPDDSSNAPAPTEGGSTTEDTTAVTSRGSEAPPEPEDDLSKSKRQANHWQTEARKASKELTAAQAELEALRLSQKSEHEQAIEKARREGADEATGVWQAKFHTAARRNEALRVMGKAGVSAPDLVMPHLNLDEVEVDADGHVDAAAIEAALQVVLETYPMLAAPDGHPTTHHADLGPKKPAPRGTDVNAALRAAMVGGKPRR